MAAPSTSKGTQLARLARLVPNASPCRLRASAERCRSRLPTDPHTMLRE